jgi:hypothetical protein
MTTLDRAAILDGLNELAALASAKGIESTIFVLGGSAVALTEGANRRTTTDIDSHIRSSSVDRSNLFLIVEEIAQRRRWPISWLNTAAQQFLPDAEENPIAWVPLFSIAGVHVLCAPAPLLLAMKLRSNRGRRDTDDLPILLVATGLLDRRAIEEDFAKYFPHDEISPKCQDWLDRNGYPSEADLAASRWTPSSVDRSGFVYIETHLRNGRWIQGHWRKR